MPVGWVVGLGEVSEGEKDPTPPKGHGRVFSHGVGSFAYCTGKVKGAETKEALALELFTPPYM